jgi:shikimate kinase
MVSDSPRVVLVGPPAAGKTRVGKRVARLLNVNFHDTDREIVAVHGPIAEIFATHGEATFRERERGAVITALGTDGVVALGGGAVINADTRADLANHRVALITISAEAVVHRLDPEKRPLLVGGLEAWEALVGARQGWYDEVSDARFDTSHRSLDTVADEIVRWIEESGPGV